MDYQDFNQEEDWKKHPWDNSARNSRRKQQQQRKPLLKQEPSSPTKVKTSKPAAETGNASRSRHERMDAARKRREQLAAGILSNNRDASAEPRKHNKSFNSSSSEVYLEDEEDSTKEVNGISYGIPTRETVDREDDLRTVSFSVPIDEPRRPAKESFMEKLRKQSVVRSFTGSSEDEPCLVGMKAARIHSRREKAFSPDDGGIWRKHRSSKGVRDGILTDISDGNKHMNLYDEEDEYGQYNRSKLTTRKLFLLLLLVLVVAVGGAYFIFYLATSRNVDTNNEIPSDPASQIDPPVDQHEAGTKADYFPPYVVIVAPGVVTTTMEPSIVSGCELGGAFPNIFDQCRCNAAISVVPEDVAQLYRELVDALAPEFYGPGVYPTHAIESCDPRNLALVWLASGNNRRDPDGLASSGSGLRDRLLRKLQEDTTFDGEIRQRFVLATFFAALDGSNWLENRYWMSAENECSWYGIECNEHGIIVNLILPENDLKGRMPVELEALQGLRTMWLAGNKLSGTIPRHIFHLERLEEMNLSENRLTGSLVEDVEHAKSIKVLHLHDNQLSGPMVSELGSLTTLKDLDISYNNLSGMIMSELGQLKGLISFVASENQLEGSLPTELYSATSLESLELGHNSLGGSLSSEIGKLKALRKFFVLVLDFSFLSDCFFFTMP
jgi:hypothetical protein